MPEKISGAALIGLQFVVIALIANLRKVELEGEEWFEWFIPE